MLTLYEYSTTFTFTPFCLKSPGSSLADRGAPWRELAAEEGGEESAGREGLSREQVLCLEHSR